MTEDERSNIDLLATLARGVIELSSLARSSAFRLPYPPSLQLALDRVVLAGLTRGRPVPAGVPELLAWCREPGLVGWPLTMPSGYLTGDAGLIHPVTDEPTRTCAELASLGPYGVLEQEAEALLGTLADACGSTERFATCRDFLMCRPVILQFDPLELLRPATAQTWRLVKELYAPVPDRFQVDELVYRCKGCLLLARSQTADGSWCEGDCSPEARALESSHRPRQVMALPFALRLFLALPGRTEQAVRSRLTGRVSLYPLGLGVHRVTDRDGMPRAFQVHDREQPAPAALRAAEVAARLDAPLAVVVPDVRATRPGYRQEFEHALPPGARVRLLSASEFTAAESTGRRVTHA
ncbi:hypothetical protein GCM10018793_55280 [Streptomyces sulfonofaciens]|uniref:pPIWI-RE three-gene island domain-containing protein n=1 Tax=Streptomyces sulfonofaciens TaxID=68272 RepID=A0A919L6L0_9ACTN|nr:hypothetical protein [Streptomyces sulfonofaciens]GHH85828.1 hypothetical protein GCM10018793_55280 [Streptomyces sulfonofaciens]